MAKVTGQRPPTPVRVVKRDISDSEGEDDAEGEQKKDGEPSKPASKAKRKVRKLLPCPLVVLTSERIEEKSNCGVL